jgi:hypothetical protein
MVDVPAETQPSKAPLFRKFRHPQKSAFLRALSICGKIGEAAEKAGINRDLPYTNAFPLPTEVRGAARESKFQETDSRAYLGSKTVQPMGGKLMRRPNSLTRQRDPDLMEFRLLLCENQIEVKQQSYNERR